jgi:hypothetical protein
MSHEVKPMRSHADAETSTVVNGSHSPNHYSPNHDYNGHGGSVARFITPGGNPIDNTQPAFPGQYSLYPLRWVSKNNVIYSGSLTSHYVHSCDFSQSTTAASPTPPPSA